jgi:hypothetical protein
VYVRFDTSHPGTEIPDDFLGLSYEAPQINNRAFYPNVTSYIQLLRNLGPGVLRFGGNSVEFTYYIDNGSDANEGAKDIIQPADLNRVFSFASDAGWKVILGLNLGHYDPQMAADEAAYASANNNGSLLAFEIGNEPDLFMRNGLRPADWNYNDFNQEFDAYRMAILAQDPGVPIDGPVTAYDYNFFSHFLQNENQNVTFASTHLYALSFNPDMSPSNPRYATIDHLLSDTTCEWEKTTVGQFVADAARYHIPLRFAETNTATGARAGTGIVDNVSPTFATSLWSADYLFILADEGVVGANFHGGFTRGGFTPLYFDGEEYRPAAEYYGMLFFHQAGTGHPIPVTADPTAGISIHSVLDDDGTLHVALINRDLSQPMTVVIPVNGVGTASVMRLSAPSVTAASGMTLGGAEVAPDGSWNPQVIESLAVHNGEIRVALPAASAAMVTLSGLSP